MTHSSDDELGSESSEEPYMERENLTVQQTDQLIQFQEISGVQDLEHCRAILERHGWNIESAVQDHLSSSDSPVSSRSPVVIPDGLPTPSLSMTLAPPRGAGFLGWTYYVIMLPFRLCTWTLQLMIHYLFFNFTRTNRRILESIQLFMSRPPQKQRASPDQDFLVATAELQCAVGGIADCRPPRPSGMGKDEEENANSSKSMESTQPIQEPALEDTWQREVEIDACFLNENASPIALPHFPLRIGGVTDPVGDVNSWIQAFESQYGMRHPRFFRGSYRQALDEAKRDLKFLLVYLHSEDHQHTRKFVVETLCNENVIEFLDNNVLLWGCSVKLGEGYNVSQIMRESTYPFLALVCLKDGQMTIVERLQGPNGPEELLTHLAAAMARNESLLATARAHREELNANRALRAAQDAAYMESLARDMERQRERQEQQEKLEREEQEKREKIQAEQRKKEMIQQQKVDLADQVPAEPSEDAPDSVTLNILLPCGRRLKRRFSVHDSLAGLYYFIFCHPDSPEEFEVATSYPKRIIPCAPVEVHTFEDVGLTASQALRVTDLNA
ncbi:unnamed protein product [Darwinula stevensoni]|uniref:UBX domain-containing protein n=1 Tax=Darwinula stevensoni TaxID=69355 RepID=A0A7R8XG09_9CRUS|nr:unnamed protein product [Darwinula stevensoni]CAG0889300.1 unnamed protein product [Darwinula stevensoni]